MTGIKTKEQIKEEFEDAKGVIESVNRSRKDKTNEKGQKDNKRSTKHFLFGLNSKQINRVASCVLSNQKYCCLQFRSPDNCCVPWWTFWMSNRNEIIKLSGRMTRRSFVRSTLHLFLFVFLE